MSLDMTLARPFDLPIEGVAALPRPLLPLARLSLNRVLSLERLNAVYAEISRRGGNFACDALDVLGVSLEMAPDDPGRIPREGGAVVVANHPFGGIEGLALLALLASVRPDVRLLANSILHRIPRLREHLIFVDPFGTSESARANIRGMKQAIRWVEEGGLLAVFPAGEVSHLDLAARRVADPEWSATIGRIIRRVKTPVVPVHFGGHNRALFQLAGLVHPRLRTVMLPREFLNKQGCAIRVDVGAPVPFSRLSRFPCDATMMNYLRERTYFLCNRTRERAPGRSSAPQPSMRRAAVAEPGNRRAIAAELHAVPAKQMLLSQGEFQVWYATADQIPEMLREIGRLRELTFRAVGEGTGAPLDLDRFDPHYHHLLLWDNVACEVAGAYRLGRTDRIISWFGRQGLYTSTLFRYGDDLLREMGPALELGRSFVQPAYQKSFSPLMLLWKGIGEYVARFPQYRRLFGPVSISDEYSTTSQRLMSAFLKLHAYDAKLGPLVRSRTPMRLRTERRSERGLPALATSLDDVTALVGEIEREGRGVPVLLRQYLKLGGRLLALNVDPDFSNVLDALICVDLTRTDRRVLQRYMGTAGAARFLAHHGRVGNDPMQPDI